MSRWVQTPPPANAAEGAVMPGVERTASVYDGHVVVVLRGDLDVTGVADAEAAITALMARGQSLAGRSMPSTVHPRLKPLVSRAEVCADRLGARVCLRLPLAAG
jgi:hypothetical protein